MALERQSIEKKDFPIGRRGYDPAAVDAHLASVAEEVEALKVTSRRRTESLASTASEQVKTIVEAAEQSAAEIQRQADDEAREIRAEAAEEAQATRQEASTQAREHVGKVSESTAAMLQRLDAMESELSALIESLRTGANRLNDDLQLLEGNLGEVQSSVSVGERFEPDAVTPEPEPVAPAVEPEPEPEPDLAELPEEPLAEADVELEESIIADGAPADAVDDAEGARLIALNMALNGTPREETDRYLAENFTLSDRETLLDEVYASVEG